MLQSELLPEYLRLCRPEDAVPPCSVEACSVQEVLQAAARGFDRDSIYYIIRREEPLEEVLGKCRMLAQSMEDLVLVNELAAAHPSLSAPEKVGLRMVPDGFDDGVRPGVRMSDLPEYARAVKKLEHLTVRGCFVNGCTDGLCGKALGKYFRACYVAAKQMTVVFPCAMPYLCAENALEAVARNQKEQPETLRDCLTEASIVAMQNETAFYAKLFIK